MSTVLPPGLARPIPLADGLDAPFWLGTQAPEDIAEAKQKGVTRPSLHSPLFKPVPGPSIETGVRAMSRAVMGLMGK